MGLLGALLLALTCFALGWLCCALAVINSDEENYQRRKERHKATVRQALAEAKDDRQRNYYRAMLEWIEADYQPRRM